MKKKVDIKISKLLNKILDNIVNHCEDVCTINKCCSEEQCVLYRIESNVLKIKDVVEEKE